MARADLLALTPADLASLTNRGTVKRAQRELESGDFTYTIAEDDGDLVVGWSDGITCQFPAGKTVHDATCSSGLLGISRHIVRSVLAYQVAAREKAPPEPHDGEASGEPAAQTLADVWDPGRFTDEDLVARFRKAAVTRARTRFEQGVLVELTRGAKPTARFLNEACTVRFLVPGDLRYATADCAETLLPTWVPLAVWAFRELPSDRLAGLLSIQQGDLPTPASLLSVFDELDGLLDEMARDGLSGAATTWSARLSRMETALRKEGLVWPAELVADLFHQHAMYVQHDARFEPTQLVQLTGELMARMRAIAQQTKSVPQVLIRGARSDRPTDIAGGRMIGVGLGVRPGKRGVTISAYLHDVDSGNVVAVERAFVDPNPDAGDSPRSFTDLASTMLTRGVSLAGLASSQLLLKSGKRTPNGLLILPRAATGISVHPQNFQWEQLKPPFAAESFAQTAARLESLPPSYLRPRRRTENLYAVPIRAVEDVAFDAARQQLTAMMRDERGDAARLVHPFHNRGAEGFDQLLQVLERRGDQVRFVCGHVRSTGRTLEIHPVSVVVESEECRLAIQPWIANNVGLLEQRNPHVEPMPAEPSPVGEYLEWLQGHLADLLHAGVNRQSASHWFELAETGRHIGFVRLTEAVTKLAEALGSRDHSVRWDAMPAIRCARELCLLVRVAMEER